MSNNVFYTVMNIDGDRFIPSDLHCDMTKYVEEAIRFDSIDESKRFMKTLREDINFKSVKVKYELEDIDRR